MHAWIGQVPEETSDGAACVRVGDVYALVVDTYATQHEWPAALRMLQDMQGRGVDADGRISAAVLQEIYSRNGIGSGGRPADGASGTAGAARSGRGHEAGSPGDESVEEVVSDEEEEGHDTEADGSEGVGDAFESQRLFGRRGSMPSESYSNAQEFGGGFGGESMHAGEVEHGIAEEDMYF